MAVAESRIRLLGVGRMAQFHFLDMDNPDRALCFTS